MQNLKRVKSPKKTKGQSLKEKRKRALREINVNTGDFEQVTKLYKDSVVTATEIERKTLTSILGNPKQSQRNKSITTKLTNVRYGRQNILSRGKFRKQVSFGRNKSVVNFKNETPVAKLPRKDTEHLIEQAQKPPNRFRFDSFDFNDSPSSIESLCLSSKPKKTVKKRQKRKQTSILISKEILNWQKHLKARPAKVLKVVKTSFHRKEKYPICFLHSL